MSASRPVEREGVRGTADVGTHQDLAPAVGLGWLLERRRSTLK
jgi:hypothetical protein